ncbi:hypothetical protein OPT61_g5913 [Boeremia exigua]|uniref:Uncharacterized protein n=1 Tax=Boeremia exigua TaxID=749465 RepID=A0ACC2I8J7_9PLEO|nr:hypothetical protein OPT61_g5913 [Boeremia exigua]
MADTWQNDDAEKEKQLCDNIENLSETSEVGVNLGVKDPNCNDISPSEQAASDAAKQKRRLLIPLKTQAIYWVVSAIAVVSINTLHLTTSRPHLVAPFLFFALVLVLFIAPRPRHTQQAAGQSLWALHKCLFVLCNTEVVWLLRFWDIRRELRPMWPLRQVLAIQFCLAYQAVSILDRPRRSASQSLVVGDGRGASVWCLPFRLQAYHRQFVWQREFVLRGVCHTALSVFVANIISQVIAYYLGAKLTVYDMVLWGTGCLGDLEPSSQALYVLGPFYDLKFWICDKILRAL